VIPPGSLTTGTNDCVVLARMIFFAISFLYNVFKSTTIVMLAAVVSGFMVVTVFILWIIWAAREVHIFTRLAKYVKHAIEGDSRH
jgi:hypothetical protein